MRRNEIYFLVALLGLAFGLYLFASPGIAAEKTYVMKGEIRAIEIASRTVVVEVPLGPKMFTVGGPLSADAVLRKGGRPAQLSDFRAGDLVTVRWKSTERGHFILALQAR